MKTFLNCFIITQYQKCTPIVQNCISRYCHTDFAAFIFDCQNIYIMFLSYVKFTYSFSNPLIRYFYFEDCMRCIDFHIIKDMIIRGGENVYPREVEEYLLSMPGVLDVQVVAVPSRKYGEEVGAFVIPRPGVDIRPEDVRDFCRGKIAWFKIPKYVEIITGFPLTASGKIQKYKLREMAAELFPNVK